MKELSLKWIRLYGFLETSKRDREVKESLRTFVEKKLAESADVSEEALIAEVKQMIKEVKAA